MEELTETISWKDSTSVLGYIVDESRAFKIFVPNRLQEIQEYNSTNQWSYISSENNTADEASIGMVLQNHTNISRWFEGPAFLWEPQLSWEKTSVEEVSQLFQANQSSLNCF